MKFGVWGLVMLSFLAGLFAHPYVEQPQYPSSPHSPEQASPQNRIPEDNIKVYKDRVEIKINNPRWARFADSNSMDPVLDQGSHGIQIIPQSCDEIYEGDVITYNFKGRKIIHRVIGINYDAQGKYFTVKGDNNKKEDPVKVRCEDIERVLVAIIY